MKPTMEILTRISENSNKNKDEIFTRLYRYMLRPDIYYRAYQNLYSNNGAATQGVDNDTADGFSEEKVIKIINSLTDESYLPKPVRRTYINKANGKKRPLGIPTFTDKLVQEALRIILEAVYEPVFLGCSHGFRPNKSCHTALSELKKEFSGAKWFIEGDIKGCFDNIDHQVLVGIIGKKIKDARIIKLIYKFLKAGYMENWQYHKTYSGCPQGGIVSPILANIYLHELDKFVMKLKSDFDKYIAQGKRTYEYRHCKYEMDKISKLIKESSGEERLQLISEYKKKRAELLKLPCKLQTDKIIKYIRYADDFLISVKGNQKDCIELKCKLSEFISNELKMELSEDKTLITHSNEYARFLGYDIRVRRSDTIKRGGINNCTKRTLNNSVELLIPLEDKIHKFIFSKNIAKQKSDGTLSPCKRNILLYLTDLEIVSIYNSQLRGICNYYNLACNFNKLNYFAYLMEYSCLKTLAAKHKSKITKIREKYKDGKGGWAIPYETKKGMKQLHFANYADCKNGKNISDIMTKAEDIFCLSITTFESRLKAKVCELCGTNDSKHYEIHHVHKLKGLTGKGI